MFKQLNAVFCFIRFSIIILCVSSCNNTTSNTPSYNSDEQMKHLELSLDDWIKIERLNSGDFISKMKELGLKFHRTVDSSDMYNIKFHWENYVYQKDSSIVFSVSRMQWNSGSNEIFLSFKSNPKYFKELKERAV